MGLNFNYNQAQTLLSEEDKEGLKILSISTREELDEFEQHNIEMAISWLQRQKITFDRFLSEQFIKDLHFRMFANVWYWAGQFRKSDKNIGVDWVNIPIEIKKMLDDVRYWLDNKTFSEDEIAIRLKHRCVSIYPFPNGNGRHSRLLADVMREKIFGRDFFSWGGINLDNQSVDSSMYISSLREVDKGNYQPLLKFAQF